MTLFQFYFNDHPAETLKIDLMNGELAIDTSLHNADGYEMENGIKKIYWQNNLPFCKLESSGKLIRFAALHYQGHEKYLMAKHYLGGGYAIKRFLEIHEIKARFKKFRRGIKGLFKS
ncbi:MULTISPECIES: hypothetical protein [unclassified Mucilaginibacter]|uniref:hypothetical protein n=1 Tax=unclassified Mucilaginibacter TaxID=2617802 RepID=UPI002AC9277D|nr:MULTISPECIES: hypothetical protein [unclassified Mucilaginibacter]MEB0262773.1 hypothetical protein [Mucilaginibacter sp. 10I4]WPX24392.1 hypothetical protein RHM67_03780 [Mucilaginibacter sp. 5C4]